MKKIRFKELIEMIFNHVNDEVPQTKPSIIWFDNVDSDLLQFTNMPTPAHFGWSLSKIDNRIAFWENTGSPLTGPKHKIDSEGKVVLISEEERYKFCFPSHIIKFENDQLITKVFIHSPFCGELQIGDNGLNSIEYGILFHQKMNIPVFIFYPFEWKNDLKVDISEYEEYLCSYSKEEEKNNWLQRASKVKPDGFQIVDNFYLDFLKSAPEKFMSYKFDSIPRYGVTFCSYDRWEYIGRRFRDCISEICTGNEIYNNPTKTQIKKFHSVFKDGNLDLEILKGIINTIPSDLWEKWINDHKYYFKYTSDLKTEIKNLENKNRMEYILSLLSYVPTKESNLPLEVCDAIYEFHKSKYENRQ